MSDSLVAAVAQFSPAPDRESNLDRIRGFAALAATRGARLLVGPEYASGFEPKPGGWLRRAAEPLDGAFVGGIAEIASDLGMTIIIGMVEEGEPLPYNTVIVVDAGGRLRARYRKVHLYQAFGQDEGAWLGAGDASEEPVVVEAGGFTIGVQTCYDLRFPESSRRLVDAGADVLAVPAEWVRGPLKEDHWRTLIAARAIENTAYLLAADQSAPIAVGRSAIVDPRGVERAAIGPEEGIAVAVLERDVIDTVRQENPALTLRRYGSATRA